MRFKQFTWHNICCCLLILVVWLCLSGLTTIVGCTFFCPLATNLLMATQELHHPFIKTAAACEITPAKLDEKVQTFTPSCCKTKPQKPSHCQQSKSAQYNQQPAQNNLSNNINKFDLKSNFINHRSSALTESPGLPLCCYIPLKESAENTENSHRDINPTIINQREISSYIPVLIKPFAKICNSAYQPDCSNTYLRCRVLLI